MKVTFNITDCTTLCGEREQNIEITDLNCNGNQMDFALQLTNCVKEFTKKYVDERNKKDAT